MTVQAWYGSRGPLAQGARPCFGPGDPMHVMRCERVTRSAKCDTRIAIGNPPAPGSAMASAVERWLNWGRPGGLSVPPEWEAARRAWPEWARGLVDTRAATLDPRLEIDHWRLTDAELLNGFEAELEALCKRFDVRLYHEDGHGAAYLVRDNDAPGYDFPIHGVRSGPL